MSSPQKPQIRRRLFGYSLIALFLLSIAAGTVWFAWWYDPIRRAEKMVAEDGPQAGATRQEVEAWLDSQSIRHKRLTSIDDSDGYPATQSPRQFVGLAPRVEGACVVGKIIAPHWSGWAREIWIYFFFDSDGRLLQHLVKSWDGYL